MSCVLSISMAEARFDPAQGPRPLPPNSNSPFLTNPKPPVNQAPTPAPVVPQTSQKDQERGDVVVRWFSTWKRTYVVTRCLYREYAVYRNHKAGNPGNRLACCKKGPYNPKTQMCCGESVKPRPPNKPNVDCCGKHMYNPTTHLCCEEGNTYLKNPNTQCCGKNTYQPNFQQCCFGDAMPQGMTCIAR
ncbi:galaxin-like 2 [Elysia marginata]|uniref:Galaxin-like 2 n=1 Tax=Elysia marginata TaxID=1093978 RepID=A0AAV4GT00_9GAST|nr:galaxin-like 2 [Elysia marginata]